MTDLNPTEAVPKDGAQFGAFKILMQFYKMFTTLPAAGQNATNYICGDADKSLARPTFRCHRTELSVIGKRGLFMCRIVSIFLLQRLKGSMSGDARDFSNMEMRAVIKFFFLQGKVPMEIHAILAETLGEHAPLYATIKNWVTQFKHSDFSTCDAPRPGQSKTVTTPDFIDQIHELILEDCQILAKSIAEQLGISHEQVGYIIHEDLDTWKLSTNWVPKCLNVDQKRRASLSNFWNFFGAIQMISCCDW